MGMGISIVKFNILFDTF